MVKFAADGFPVVNSIAVPGQQRSLADQENRVGNDRSQGTADIAI
jgi:hypothetical protein